MKPIHILIAALLFCSIAVVTIDGLQQHHIIRVVVWDTDGNREPDVPVAFAYGGTTETLYSAGDGTLSFSLLNFDDVPDGACINISCKHGAKDVPVNYTIGATGVTFNEPSEADAIETFAALGFVATAIGGGLYLLRRKKQQKQHIQEDNMTKEETDEKSKLIRDFGVRALIATLSITGFILTTAIAVYQNNTDMIDPIMNWYMPILMAIVAFYFAGSITRDSK